SSSRTTTYLSCTMCQPRTSTFCTCTTLFRSRPPSVVIACLPSFVPLEQGLYRSACSVTALYLHPAHADKELLQSRRCGKALAQGARTRASRQLQHSEA